MLMELLHSGIVAKFVVVALSVNVALSATRQILDLWKPQSEAAGVLDKIVGALKGVIDFLSANIKH